MAMHDCTGLCEGMGGDGDADPAVGAADSFADVTFTSYNKVALHSGPQYSEGQRALEARAKTAEGDRRSVYCTHCEQFQHFLAHWPFSIIHHSNI